MKYHEMTKNYIFRELVCGMSIEKTAELCFKSVRTVKLWDAGKPIPPECKRLMRFYCNRELGIDSGWEGFCIVGDKLALPTGRPVSPQQILAGIALTEIGSELELRTSTKILEFARLIAKLKK
ncbi:phage protein [Vibrio genomosp. F6]|uniref:Regulator n=1 Tax=Vibrio genomosp. F6 str. FF-238 TaxID=1191298 RepID=A0A1E5D764_9VIBR|nr:phage protein [Vibrio genomosp. F6]OEE79451.1 regulator [Vibrio genomosp. F6 str. FF-238]